MVISSYLNGNYSVEILNDGTRIKRSQSDFRPQQPDNLDIKITNFCTSKAGCMAHCLVADSLISTPSGYKKIQEMRIGDTVFSYDVENKKVILDEVDQLFQREVEEDIYDIELETGEVIRPTNNHEFLTQRGWIRADELSLKDRIYRYKN